MIWTLANRYPVRRAGRLKMGLRPEQKKFTVRLDPPPGLIGPNFAAIGLLQREPEYAA